MKVSEEGCEKLVAANTVPITENESFEGKIFHTPNGDTVVDFGQNIAGYVEFTIHAKEGQTITLYHGETLDENGNFTMENFEDRRRHKENGVYQMLHYTCKKGVNHYKPRFTIMGFDMRKWRPIYRLNRQYLWRMQCIRTCGRQQSLQAAIHY